jgi:hypothetical protein
MKREKRQFSSSLISDGDRSRERTRLRFMPECLPFQDMSLYNRTLGRGQNTGKIILRNAGNLEVAPERPPG